MKTNGSFLKKLLSSFFFLLFLLMTGCGGSSSVSSATEVPKLSQEEIDRYVSADGHVVLLLLIV